MKMDIDYSDEMKLPLHLEGEFDTGYVSMEEMKFRIEVEGKKIEKKLRIEILKMIRKKRRNC